MQLPTKIKDIIPHKPPMLLVDELLECSGDEALVLAAPGPTAPFSDGRFLDRLAGIEMIAQAYAAYRAWQAQNEKKTLKTGFLVGVQRSSLQDLPCSSPLEIRVKTVGEFEEFAVAEGLVSLQGEALCEARLKLWSPLEVT
ncbi:MAG: hypothetical protein ACLFSY_11155 [Desulfonatronovibrionaceae bacterium]